MPFIPMMRTAVVLKCEFAAKTNRKVPKQVSCVPDAHRPGMPHLERQATLPQCRGEGAVPMYLSQLKAACI